MLEEPTQRILSTLPVQVRIGRLRLVVMDGGFFCPGPYPGRRVLNKVLYEEVPPRGSIPYPFIWYF